MAAQQMNLRRALRLSETACINLVGAGGKTSALFALARQYPRALVSATTHLGAWQLAWAQNLVDVGDPQGARALAGEFAPGVSLFYKGIENQRAVGLPPESLKILHTQAAARRLPLILESDGARGCPLKAPAAHEPALYAAADAVVVCAGLSALGQPCDEAHVHRPKIFARLSGLDIGAAITPQAVATVLTHPLGGLKDIPAEMRRVCLLTQADTPARMAAARRIAENLLPAYHAMVIANLPLPNAAQTPQVHACFEPVGAVILAAGGGTRMGGDTPKPLLLWQGKPLVRYAAERALNAGVAVVRVVIGAHASALRAALAGLPVEIIENPHWQDGQSTSIRAALNGLPDVGALIFMPADQPQTPPTLLRALIDLHAQTLAPVLAPMVDGARTTPTLFDRETFAALNALRGDVGGRAIFGDFPPAYLPWHDFSQLLDVDTPEDYARLLDIPAA
ncbi:MAG: hypothetical protein OHK0052_27100 [Anaerolineales bacterium]